MTVTIYHNPRCSKSIRTLELIQEKDISPIIIEYLKSNLTSSEINLILQSLDSTARGIIRNSEATYKALKLEDDLLSEEVLINAIVQNPELLQRPIVLNKDTAVIGRPPEKVLEIL